MGEITIQLNGDLYTTSATTVTELLDTLGLDHPQVIVEYNHRVLPANGTHTQLLNAHDTIEIIRYIGGGHAI
jgi:thiamine biosynthesis protein ThiS